MMDEGNEYEETGGGGVEEGLGSRGLWQNNGGERWRLGFLQCSYSVF